MKCGDPTCHCEREDPPLRVPDELRNASLLPGMKASMLKFVAEQQANGATGVSLDAIDRELDRIERAPKLSFAEQHRVLSEFLDPTPTRKQRLLRAIAGALRRLAAWVEN